MLTRLDDIAFTCPRCKAANDYVLKIDDGVRIFGTPRFKCPACGAIVQARGFLLFVAALALAYLIVCMSLDHWLMQFYGHDTPSFWPAVGVAVLGGLIFAWAIHSKLSKALLKWRFLGWREKDAF